MRLRIDVGIVRQVDNDGVGGGKLAHGDSDLCAGKAAILKEAGLLCTFGPAGGGSSELPPPDLSCEGIPIDLCGAQVVFDHFGGDAALAQLGPDTIRPLPPPRMLANEAVDEAVVRDHSALCQPRYDRIECSRIEAPSLQLPPQIACRQLTAGQQTHGSEFDGALVRPIGLVLRIGTEAQAAVSSIQWHRLAPGGTALFGGEEGA